MCLYDSEGSFKADDGTVCYVCCRDALCVLQHLFVMKCCRFSMSNRFWKYFLSNLKNEGQRFLHDPECIPANRGIMLLLDRMKQEECVGHIDQ